MQENKYIQIIGSDSTREEMDESGAQQFLVTVIERHKAQLFRSLDS
jgi:hypothetical protein